VLKLFEKGEKQKAIDLLEKHIEIMEKYVEIDQSKLIFHTQKRFKTTLDNLNKKSVQIVKKHIDESKYKARRLSINCYNDAVDSDSENDDEDLNEIKNILNTPGKTYQQRRSSINKIDLNDNFDSEDLNSE
jgi:hypothetical protein